MKNRLVKCKILILAWWPLISYSQHDTTYYIHYPGMLGLGIFQAQRNNTISLEKVDAAGTPNKVNYLTNGKSVTGFIFNYDKIYFALGFKTQPKEDVASKGLTKYNYLVLQLRNNKWVVEAGYRKYRGFYDGLTPASYSSLFSPGIYYQDGSLSSRSIKLKTLHFFNHKKFSYNAAYLGSYRQLKSAASWVASANFYSDKIWGDSSIIPPYARPAFREFSLIKSIRTNAFSAGGGGSANVVLKKKFYANLTLTLQLEPQFRNYEFTGYPDMTLTILSVSSDQRVAIGYNSRRFFAVLSVINDVTLNNVASLKLSSNVFTTTFAMGYRFAMKKKLFSL